MQYPKNYLENQAKKLAKKAGGWADMQYMENYFENQAKKLTEKAGGRAVMQYHEIDWFIRGTDIAETKKMSKDGLTALCTKRYQWLEAIYVQKGTLWLIALVTIINPGIPGLDTKMYQGLPALIARAHTLRPKKLINDALNFGYLFNFLHFKHILNLNS